MITEMIKPPNRIPLDRRRIIFLAGSIEMGDAPDWQDDVAKRIMAKAKDSVVILNPRRDDWDSSWEQSIDHPQFREQVEWELRGIEVATKVGVALIPGTKSPISLMELALAGRKCIVYCPEGFWRKGNVDIVCERYQIRKASCLDELATKLAESFEITVQKEM